MNHFKLSILALFITSAGLAQIPAPAPLPDDLRALLQQANTYFPQLKQQQEQINAGRLQSDIIHTALLPNLTGNASYLYVNPVPQAVFPINGRDVNLQFQPHHNLNANLSVNQSVYDFGRTRANMQRAQDNVQILQRNLETTRHNLAYQVAAAYYGIGFLQRSLIVQDSVIKTAASNVQVLVNRLKNGDALQYDVLTQQVRLKVAINRKIDQQNQLEHQAALLTYLTGAANPVIGPGALNFDTSIQAFNVDTQLQNAATTNFDILSAQDRVRLAQTDIQIDQLSGRPNLGFTGSAGYKNGYVPDVNNLRFNVAAGVALSVPIYAGKRYQLQNRVAQINLNASRYGVESANAQLRQNLTQLNADIRSNQTRLQNLETQVLQARKALDIANARLRNGVITNVELESAETGVEEAELGRLLFQYQLLLNQLELNRLTGEPLLRN